MKLSSFDYSLAVIADTLSPALRHAGDIETTLLGTRLSQIPIERPVFITGLARSGTTIVLERMAQASGVATHRYRDFPFPWTVVAWNRFQDRAADSGAAVERPHGDRIQISRDSPDAFEEPIWQHFFKQVHAPDECHVLDPGDPNLEFDTFFRDHVRKIVMLRGGSRYVSKGNYNVARIRYLARLFPDALFVVPIREPLAHVHSLVTQHKRFTDFAMRDKRVGRYLRAAGHYEFGPQRQPINLTESSASATLEAWDAGDDYRGYAAMWAQVYGYVHRLLVEDPQLSQHVQVVHFEALCSQPHETVKQLAEFAGLAADGIDWRSISAPADMTSKLAESVQSGVRDETRLVAAQFGYET